MKLQNNFFVVTEKKWYMKFLFIGGCVRISRRNKSLPIKCTGMFQRTLTILIRLGTLLQNYLFSSVIVLSELETTVIPQ